MKATDEVVSIAVTPVNFDEIIEASKGHPSEEQFTLEKLQEIRAEARARNTVAFVFFRDDSMWHSEEQPGRVVHDTGDWRSDR